LFENQIWNFLKSSYSCDFQGVAQQLLSWNTLLWHVSADRIVVLVSHNTCVFWSRYNVLRAFIFKLMQQFQYLKIAHKRFLAVAQMSLTFKYFDLCHAVMFEATTWQGPFLIISETVQALRFCMFSDFPNQVINAQMGSHVCFDECLKVIISQMGWHVCFDAWLLRCVNNTRWIGVGFLIRDLSYNQLTGGIPFNIGFLQVATL